MLILPTITNGQIFNGEVRKTVNQRTVLQKGIQRNTPKMITTVAHRKHKILIIGNSHVRALSNKVRNSLDDAVSVLGIVKPNANIEVSTTALHLENLTKKDLIIFFWWN